MGILTGVGVVGPAQDAARPPLFGIALMVFACYDCWPDEFMVPGAIMAVRFAWAALRRQRQTSDRIIANGMKSGSMKSGKLPDVDLT
jgi:hypothetical protein